MQLYFMCLNKYISYLLISVHIHKPLQIIKSLATTGWGKQKETLMATYKTGSRVCLLHRRPALRTATGCTQDICMTKYSRFPPAPTAPRHHIPYTNILHPRAQSALLSTTAAIQQIFPHTSIQLLQQT